MEAPRNRGAIFAIFAKKKPKMANFEAKWRISRNSQVLTFYSVGLKYFKGIRAFWVSWQSNMWLIFFSLIIFSISKISKIQPFLSQKNSQNIQKTKGISSDPDSKHIGLPLQPIILKEKLVGISKFWLKFGHKLTKINLHSNRCYGANKSKLWFFFQKFVLILTEFEMLVIEIPLCHKIYPLWPLVGNFLAFLAI